MNPSAQPRVQPPFVQAPYAQEPPYAQYRPAQQPPQDRPYAQEHPQDRPYAQQAPQDRPYSQEHPQDRRSAPAKRDDGNGLERFVAAQEAKTVVIGSSYKRALSELQDDGRKSSHWIWYVFPQLLDPCRRSANNTRFQIRSRSEGQAYLQHPTLGPRYCTCVHAVVRNLDALKKKKCALIHIMGGLVDAKKFYHSVSTFAMAALEAARTRGGEEEVVISLLASALIGICGDSIGPDIQAAMDMSPEAAQLAQALKKQHQQQDEPPPREVIPILVNAMIKEAWNRLPE